MSDLSDAEFDELDELLARTPEPYRPLDAVMLDGYLCGVLVQPRLIGREDWLPPIFDLDGAAFPASADAAWRSRCEALITRRHDALRQALVEDGGFDPLLPGPDTEPEELPEALRALGPISLALMPWVAGFEHAAVRFPYLLQMRDDDVAAALARLHRHLPASDEEPERPAEPAPAFATLDEAIDDLVGAVADLADLTHEQRWHVDTVKRAAAKVGRNDPCPCGSGKKFKQCHGAA